MTIFDAFERIYLINLPHRRDRLRDSLAQLRRAGLRPNDPRLRIFPAIRPADAGVFPSRGAHGCYLSHLQVLREARRQGLANVLILEDDIALVAAACQPLPEMRIRIQEGDWDFAYPGHIEALMPAQGVPVEWQTTDQGLVCAHFYAVNRRVLPMLLDYLESCMARPAGHPDGGPMHIDGAYSMFRQRSSRTCTLIAAPSLGGQRSSRSDIYANRWFDRWPLFRTLAGQARQLRNLLKQTTNA